MMFSSGGLISYGVLHLEGLWGLHGWQLLFLVEGIPSVLSGFLTYFYLPNEPMDCDFLTPEEQQCAVDRLAHARQIPVANQETIPAEQLQKKKISWEDLRNTLLDWRVWALSFLYLNILITLYSLSFFLPAIIGQFGYSVLKSNLLSVPIYAFAGVVTIFVSMSSDRRNERFLHCAVCISRYFQFT
jgi:sugar phosphate permease